jgi:hypothetical protein
LGRPAPRAEKRYAESEKSAGDMKETPQLVDIKLVNEIQVTEPKWVEQKGSME